MPQERYDVVVVGGGQAGLAIGYFLARAGLNFVLLGRRTGGYVARSLGFCPRTVEWHLRKVFTKLGIRSRRELPRALPSSDSKLVPA